MGENIIDSNNILTVKDLVKYLNKLIASGDGDTQVTFEGENGDEYGVYGIEKRSDSIHLY